MTIRFIHIISITIVQFTMQLNVLQMTTIHMHCYQEKNEYQIMNEKAFVCGLFSIILQFYDFSIFYNLLHYSITWQQMNLVP